jgi:hypothetical protein
MKMKMSEERLFLLKCVVVCVSVVKGGGGDGCTDDSHVLT